MNSIMPPVGPPERRDEEELVVGMPWYVRAIALIGIPGALAVYLVWIGGQELPAIDRAVVQIASDVVRNREMMREHAEELRRLHQLVQRVCSSTAKTDEERAHCFD
jgi:hypothetical protein